MNDATNTGTYTIGDETADSFIAAVSMARAKGCDVIETATGVRRWTPGKMSKPAPVYDFVMSDGSIVRGTKIKRAFGG